MGVLPLEFPPGTDLAVARTDRPGVVRHPGTRRPPPAAQHDRGAGHDRGWHRRRVSGRRAHRHARRDGLLPQRRHPADRAAEAEVRRQAQATGSGFRQDGRCGSTPRAQVMAVSASSRGEVEYRTAIGRPLREPSKWNTAVASRCDTSVSNLPRVRIRSAANRDRDADQGAELARTDDRGPAQPHRRIRSLPRPDSAVCHWPTPAPETPLRAIRAGDEADPLPAAAGRDPDVACSKR